MSLKMKKLCFAFIGVLSLLTAVVCADDRPTAIDDFYATQERTRVIAHRGFSGAAPENTLAAVRAAIEVGADMVEIDVTLTSDGHIVVIHDETLDRTTTGSGRVSDFTLAELQRLDAGGWFAPRFAGERIPTLDQVLDEIEGRILLNVEIKSEAVERGVVTKVASAIRKRGMMEHVVVSSFSPTALQQMHFEAPEIRSAVLYNTKFHKGQDAVVIVTDLGASVFNIKRQRLTKRMLRRCREHENPDRDLHRQRSAPHAPAREKGHQRHIHRPPGSTPGDPEPDSLSPHRHYPDSPRSLYPLLRMPTKPVILSEASEAESKDPLTSPESDEYGTLSDVGGSLDYGVASLHLRSG